ncbi:hypothetical protein C1H46_001991 [Malus baccata]|uniref:Uncharacterized protein n=1 Tax=Malus baccata TaxID=106549 RepID=A0A540NMS3_MALBA|nr:hypothetical protein C1H46_001991 [Malus baccata]
MASNPQNEPRASREVEKPPIEPIRPPTVEEMRSQDIWSNCAIRSVVSGVMGMAIVLSFGLIFGFSHMGFDSFFVFPCLVAEKMWESFYHFYCWFLFFVLYLCVVAEETWESYRLFVRLLSRFIYLWVSECAEDWRICKVVIGLVVHTNLLLLGYECIKRGVNFIILK